MNDATRQHLAERARSMAVWSGLLADRLSPESGVLDVDESNSLADRIDEAHAEICDHLAVEPGGKGAEAQGSRGADERQPAGCCWSPTEEGQG